MRDRRLLPAVMVGMVVAVLMAPVARAAGPGGATAPPRTAVAVRTFHVRYHTVSEASDVAQAFLSRTGSVTVHPGQRTVTVQDTPDAVRRIGRVLEIFDQPQPSMRVEVRLIEASNDPAKKMDGPARALDGVDPGVRRVFHFKSYRMLGKATLTWDAPGPMEVDLGKGYHLSTTASWQQRIGVAPAGSSPGPVLHARDLRVAWNFSGEMAVRGMLQSRRLVLENLTLTRVDSHKGRPLLRTRTVLSPGQRAIIGASSSENSDRVLVLVIRALEPSKRAGRS